MLMWALGLASPQPIVRVDVAFGSPIRPRVEASAMEEVTAIWAPYGVDIQTADLSGPRRDGAVRLTVVLAAHTDAITARDALGSILFHDDLPLPSIFVYPNTIADLVSTTTVLGRTDREWTTGFREFVHGRVLGRALAHEIGHFLMRSRRHSSAGLMRARQPVWELVSPARDGFTLSADDIARLASVESQAGRSGGDARPTTP